MEEYKKIQTKITSGGCYKPKPKNVEKLLIFLSKENEHTDKSNNDRSNKHNR
jgi:hypothetical protein